MREIMNENKAWSPHRKPKLLVRTEKSCQGETLENHWSLHPGEQKQVYTVFKASSAGFVGSRVAERLDTV